MDKLEKAMDDISKIIDKRDKQNREVITFLIKCLILPLKELKECIFDKK